MPRSRKTQPLSAQANGTAIPTSFRCHVGGEWKPLDSFSKTQQEYIRQQTAQLRPIDAHDSGMTCKDHAGGPQLELECELCGLRKSKDEFSKSSRKKGDYKCKRCVAWVETQEPSVVPTPLETGHVSREEENGGYWGDEPMCSADFFPDDIVPEAPVSDLSSVGLGSYEENLPLGMKSSASTTSAQNSTLTSRGVLKLPPHLRSLQSSTTKPSSASKGSGKHQAVDSTATSTTGTVKSSGLPSMRSSVYQNLPPHLAHRFGPSDSSSVVASSISTATTRNEAIDEAQRRHQIPFNAWDSKGLQRLAIKNPTISSSKTSASAQSDATQNDPNVIGNWDRMSTPLPNPTKTGWHKSERYETAPDRHVGLINIDPGIDCQRLQKQLNVEDFDELR